jgi:alkanesulfonate monooxygenase
VPEPLFVGVGPAREASELVPAIGPAVQADQLRSVATAHEAAGFDAVLIGSSPTSPDPVVIAASVLQTTSRLRVVVGVGPAQAGPIAAARSLATLDALYPGRVSAHLPAVRSDADARRDGLPADRAARQRQRAEFADALVRTWTSDRPFALDGEFVRADGAWSAIRPAATLPIWVSGDSPASAQLAARHDAVHLTTAAGALASSASSGSSATGASPARRALGLRPIVGPTSAAAAEYADRVLRVRRSSEDTRSRALREATGALPGAGSLVGTTDEVAATLLGYLALGIEAFHLVGWQPRSDAYRYGEVIAAVRAAVDATRSVRRTA